MPSEMFMKESQRNDASTWGFKTQVYHAFPLHCASGKVPMTSYCNFIFPFLTKLASKEIPSAWILSTCDGRKASRSYPHKPDLDYLKQIQMPLLMALLDEQKSLTNDAQEVFFYPLHSCHHFQDSPFSTTDVRFYHHGILLHLIFNVISPQFYALFP